jgi:imidazolonepropionase-like amidohydrolase
MVMFLKKKLGNLLLNPALLHIDDKVGSIKVGKDADVVLWSANPLSIYQAEKQLSKVQYTMMLR